MYRTTRLSLTAVALITALTLTGCTFTTTPEPEKEPPSASTSSAEPSDAPETGETNDVTAPLTLDALAGHFIEAGLIGEDNRGHLSVDGIATDGIAWDAGSSQDQYFELFYVDPKTADQTILDNVERAREEGHAMMGDFPVTIDDVRGPFMIHYSATDDPDAFKTVWEEATAGLK